MRLSLKFAISCIFIPRCFIWHCDAVFHMEPYARFFRNTSAKSCARLQSEKKSWKLAAREKIDTKLTRETSRGGGGRPFYNLLKYTDREIRRDLLFELFCRIDLLNSLFATFANLHSYTHAYCSFVLLNEAIPIVSGSHCAHALLVLIWLLVLQVKRYSELKIVLPKWRPNSSAPQNNVACLFNSTVSQV